MTVVEVIRWNKLQNLPPMLDWPLIELREYAKRFVARQEREHRRKFSRLVYWNTFFGRKVYKNLDTHEYWWEGGQVVVKA